MSVKQNVLFTILSLFSQITLAQAEIYLKSTVGNYAMSDMKDFQNSLLTDFNSFNLQAEVVSEFPWSIQVEVGFRQPIAEEYEISFFTNYAITQGRIHYRDYSGEFSNTMDLKRIGIGAQMNTLRYKGLSVYFRGLYGFTLMDISSRTAIFDLDEISENIGLQSSSFSVQPGVDWKLELKKFSVIFDLGYELNALQGNITLRDEPVSFLIDAQDNPYKIDWSGLRISVALGYRI